MSLEAFVEDAALDWLDETGRPLGERASAHWDGVVARGEGALATCPYADRRRGSPMNVSALAQVQRHWPAVLDALSAHGGPTAAAAWRATCRLRWSPLWGPRPVPSVVAATFKTALGLNRPLTAWLLQHPGAAAEPLHQLIDPQELLVRLDAEGWLHGQHLVCSAPPGMLRASWTALHSDHRAQPHPADAAVAWVCGLWAVLGATRRLLRRGVLDEVPGWSPVADPRPDWPLVARWLGARGPGALVREVARFPPRLVLRLWDDEPPALVTLVDEAERADTLRGLDEAWARYLDDQRRRGHPGGAGSSATTR